MTPPPFARTECSCRLDVANCYLQPGFLGVGDAAAIARYLGAPSLEPKLFRRGRTVLGATGSAVRLEIPTIVPAKRTDGTCVFLTANDLLRDPRG